MDRKKLFGGSAALFGAIVIVDYLLRTLLGGYSFATGFGVFAGGLALVGGLNILWRPDRASDVIDSAVAYVLALATVGLFIQTILRWV